MTETPVPASRHMNEVAIKVNDFGKGPACDVEPAAFDSAGDSAPTTASNHSPDPVEPQEIAVAPVLDSPFTPIRAQRSVAATAELETAPEPGPAQTQEAFQPAPLIPTSAPYVMTKNPMSALKEYSNEEKE